MAVLLSIFLALAGGQSIGVILGGLTLANWVGLASFVIGLEPELAATLTAAHPLLARLISSVATAIENGAAPGAASHAAAHDVHEWLARNGDAAIRSSEQRDSAGAG